MRIFTIALLMVVLIFNTSATHAQEITVPDLKGLSVPEAAKIIGEAGLLFKGETQERWTESAEVKADQISAQEPSAGQSIAQGTAITVTVLRDYTVELVYDAQQLTFRNTGKTPLALNEIAFRSGVDKTLKEFTAEEWGTAALKPGACYRLTITVRAKTPTPVPPSDCTNITKVVQVTANSPKLFWQQDFRVQRSDHNLAECTAASGKCAVPVPQGKDSDNVDYLNFNYRDRHLSIRNDSEHWMVLSNIEATGRNGKKLRLDTMDNLANGDVLWAGQRLAPGQCIVYSEFDVAELPPYDCKVVGYVKLAEGNNFWTRGFTIRNLVTAYTASCVAPKPGLLSVCVIQRETPITTK